MSIMVNLSANQCVFNDTTGSTTESLYLGYFFANNVILRYDADTKANNYCGDATYSYSPCSNSVDCAGAVSNQINQYCPQLKSCVNLCLWDDGETQPSYNNDTKTWSFRYNNGDTYLCLNASKHRTVNINWHCNATITDEYNYYIITNITNPTQSCHYDINIESKWACLGEKWDQNDDNTDSSGLQWYWILIFCCLGVCVIVFIMNTIIYLVRNTKLKDNMHDLDNPFLSDKDAPNRS